jgi:hypothetical protein
VGSPEVPVLALAETVTTHVDRAAEQLVALVQVTNLRGLPGR